MQHNKVATPECRKEKSSLAWRVSPPNLPVKTTAFYSKPQRLQYGRDGVSTNAEGSHPHKDARGSLLQRAAALRWPWLENSSQTAHDRKCQLAQPCCSDCSREAGAAATAVTVQSRQYLEVTRNLPNQSSKWCLAQQQLSALLVAANLP